MNSGKMIFTQLMEHLPLHEFRKCVKRYKGDHWVKTFRCLDQFYCMAFGQLTERDGLRDIEIGLRSVQKKLYHMGIRGRVSRSTLAEANESRDWRIFEDFAQVLIGKAQRLYADEQFGLRLKASLYALDATTIDLCLSVFPWAKFRTTKAGIKLHTLLELKAVDIPVFVHICKAQTHEVQIFDQLVIEPGAFYIVDRGYLDYKRLYRLTKEAAFFITRTKSNSRYSRRYSRPVDKSKGLLFDQEVTLDGFYSKLGYPAPLRRVGYEHPESGKRLVFLTNNFQLAASTIARLYRARWRVELFFKWIKQHLRIKKFHGTTENAVKTQIWIALSVYLLVAIVKKQLGLKAGLYTILRFLSLNLFEKTGLITAFRDFESASEQGQPEKQLSLFSF